MEAATKVFISSTLRDLRNYREQVIRSLQKSANIEVLENDGLKAYPDPPISILLRMIDECDIFIGIYAYLYGSFVPNTQTSYIEQEYHYAKKIGKPILPFILDKKQQWPADLIEKDPASIQRLDTLKSDIYTEHTVNFFTTPEDLAIKISAAVHSYLDRPREKLKQSNPNDRSNDATEGLTQNERLDRWIHYSYKNWYRARDVDGVYLRTSLQNLVSQANQLVDQYNLEASKITVNDILKLVSKISDVKEAGRTYLECSIISYRAGDMKRAVSYALDARSKSASDMWERTMISWILGLLLWEVQRRVDSVAEWEGSLQGMRELAAQQPNRNAPLKRLMDNCVDEMSNALQVITSQNHLPLPPVDLGPLRKLTSVDVPEQSKSVKNDPQKSNGTDLGFVEKSKVINVITDQTNTPDKLNYQRYANAFAELICNSEMSTPITIGIYGQWGKGKSFLMRKIKTAIQSKILEREAQKQVGIDVRIIEFNAWSYSGSEHLWAGLVTRLYDEVEKFMGFHVNWNRLTSAIKHSWKRTVGVALFYLVLIMIAIGLSVLLNFSKLQKTWNELWLALNAIWLSILGGSFLASLPILWSALRDFTDTLFLSRAKNLQKVAAKPDFRDQIGVMADIKKEIKFISSVLKNKRKPKRVVLFIDDLDRCSHKKAVEVLQAIMLLLADDDGSPFVIFLGIDARVIVSAIEENYGDVLVNAGINGYEYLDKIVQIPFVIPTASRSDIQDYVDSLLWSSEEEKSSVNRRLHENAHPLPDEPNPSDLKGSVNKSSANDSHSSSERTVEKDFPQEENQTKTDFTEEVTFTKPERDALMNCVDEFSTNPRKIKRIINIYRLARLLLPPNFQDYEKFIRWILLTEQWPLHAAWILEEIENTNQKTEELEMLGDEPIQIVYEIVKKYIYTEEMGNLINIDSDPILFDAFISQEPYFTLKEVYEIFHPLTFNLNPAIRFEVRKYALRISQQAQQKEQESSRDVDLLDVMN